MWIPPGQVASAAQAAKKPSISSSIVSKRRVVRQPQRLVTRPELGTFDRTQIDAGRAHQGQRALDLAGDRFVAPSFRAREDEVLVPGVRLVQACEAAVDERPDHVEP